MKPNGIAIINADDPFFNVWQQASNSFTQITFAIHQKSDIQAKNISYNYQTKVTDFDLVTPAGEIHISLLLLGEHNVMNALAAAACAYAAKINNVQIKQGLELVQPVKGRMQFKYGAHGVQIIDDTYNANPASFNAALQVLQNCAGRKWVVLGDMHELGQKALQFHTSSGQKAYSAGVEKFLTVGELSLHANHAFGKNAQHFETHDHLIKYLVQNLAADLTVLVKGSRAMRMERIVYAMQES